MFYGFYRIILRNETFHQLNRCYLVASAVLSFGIPFWYSDYVQSWFLTQQINEVIYTTVLNPKWITVRATPTSTLTWMDVLKVVYVIGLVTFTVRLIVILAQLVVVLKRKSIQKYEAFSFFGYSFVADTLQKRDIILAHEHVHIQQLHSFDVMLFEVIAILNWFNPIVYLYKQDVKHIHEFIADEIASTKEVSKAEYAMLLFSREFGVLNPSTLTNQFFNHSTLKRRIFMLQKTKSKQTALLKYGLIFPLFILMLVFSSAWVAKNEGLEKISESLKVEVIEEKPPREITGKIIPDNLKSEIEKIEVNLVKGNRRIKYVNAKINETFKFDEIEDDMRLVVVVNFKNGKESVFQYPIGKENYYEIKVTDNFPPPTPPAMLGEVTITPEVEEVFTSVEQNPEFEGGNVEALKFIGRNIRYPQEARENNTEGRVFIRFIIEKDGSASNPTILKRIGSGCDEEALRVIKSMPKWKPGKQNGQPVRVYFTLPVHFVIENDKPQPEIQNKLQEVVVATMPSQKMNPNLNINNATTNVKIYGIDDAILLVDGVIVSENQNTIQNIEPRDIESISVLKKGDPNRPHQKNDMIIITTKKRNQDGFLTNKEYSDLAISGGFSPNGDGINDVFMIKTIKKIELLEVYDKFGKLVYRKENYQNDWDGKSNGVVVENGTYYYQIKLEGEAKPRYGYLTVQK